MPISKNGKKYYTDEQLEYAISTQISTFEYARANGYEIIKKGNVHVLKEHDSLVLFPNGSWRWFSKSVGGNAMDFLIRYEERSFVEAVLVLNGEQIEMTQKDVVARNVSAYEHKEPDTDRQVFELPSKAASNNRLYGYLCKTRQIDVDIVKQLVAENKVYLSANINTNTGKEINNATFVGYDENGIAKNAFMRGTWTPPGGKAFKKVIESSELLYPFHIIGNCDIVEVFEGAIDAMAKATLDKDFQKQPHRIALGGLSINPLLYFLEHHPEVKTIMLALDNDIDGVLNGKPHNHGQEVAKKFANELKTKGYDECNISILTPMGKDWNEDLLDISTELEMEM